MALKLMYITNRPEIARIVDEAGVDRIFVDMEYIGKDLRQGGMDTVQSRHTVQDAAAIRKVLRHAQLLVRCNPIHEATKEYGSSKEEIDAVVAAGADLIMLPYFKTAAEVRTFVELVAGRAKTMLLVETPEAAACIDEILQIDGIDECHIGLNDLSLGYGMKFMFEPLANGTVDMLCKKFREKGIPYGFGGIAALGKGMLPAERVICEHYRLGSTGAILSRSFCNTMKILDLEEVRHVFVDGLQKIRDFELHLQKQNGAYFGENRTQLISIVDRIVENL